MIFNLFFQKYHLSYEFWNIWYLGNQFNSWNYVWVFSAGFLIILNESIISSSGRVLPAITLFSSSYQSISELKRLNINARGVYSIFQVIFSSSNLNQKSNFPLPNLLGIFPIHNKNYIRILRCVKYLISSLDFFHLFPVVKFFVEYQINAPGFKLWSIFNYIFFGSILK